MKRKREDEKSASDPALIKLEYSNLPTESRHKLDALLHEWKAWHANRFLEGFRPAEVQSGTLRYEPNGALSSLPETILPVLDDRPAPDMHPITRTMWFNVQYERTGEVPSYERAVDRPLKLPAAATAIKSVKVVNQPGEETVGPSLVENGHTKLINEEKQAATPEGTTRDAVLAFPGVAGRGDDETLVIIPASGGGGGKTSKRQRLGQRCFNCGSYAHSLRECWKEYNPEAIEEARRRLLGVTGGAAGPKRYFSIDTAKPPSQLKKKNTNGGNSSASSSGEDEEEDGELEESLDEDNLDPYEKLQREFPLSTPGILSTSLREALGIGTLDPPPWLHAMRAMGLPPAYKPSPVRAAHIEKERAGVVEEEVPPPPPPTEPPVGKNGEEKEQNKELFLLPVIEDRQGFGYTIYLDSKPAENENFIKLNQVDDDVEDEDNSEKEQESSGINRVYREDYDKIRFPGVNAPIPEGADLIQWGMGGRGGDGSYQHHQQLLLPPPPPPPPPLPPALQQRHTSMYSAVSPPPSRPHGHVSSYDHSYSSYVDYYAHQSYQHQEWHQYQQQGQHSEYYHHPPPPAALPPPAYQGDYDSRQHYQQQQNSVPPPPHSPYEDAGNGGVAAARGAGGGGDVYYQGGYYQSPPPPHHIPPPSSSSVLPYQPPPPPSHSHQPHMPSPPPPPPSDAGHWRAMLCNRYKQ